MVWRAPFNLTLLIDSRSADQDLTLLTHSVFRANALRIALCLRYTHSQQAEHVLGIKNDWHSMRCLLAWLHGRPSQQSGAGEGACGST